MRVLAVLVPGLVGALALPAPAAAGVQSPHLAVTSDWRALMCLGIFALAYVVVITEEYHSLRKSKPVILAAGGIWALIGLAAPSYGLTHDDLHKAAFANLEHFGGLFLFLLAAMTYINAMNDRNVFGALRSWLASRRMSYRRFFWATGALAFFLSGVVDNLIAALLMGAVVVTVAGETRKFATVACVNVVVAANAGGAFSPFGDITTLMVWQSGKMGFFEFFQLFPASVVTYLVPALCMTPFIPEGVAATAEERSYTKRGALRTCVLFGVTVLIAVTFEQAFGIPPFLGMMTGLSLLMIFTYYVQWSSPDDDDDEFDIFREVGRAEWDTLLFFFGVIFCVGGLALLGYLELASGAMYGHYGPTVTNIAVGVASAVVDNIPVMVAVLTMDPDMSTSQWLLVTLTAGVGGSLLAIGSAAGVGLMGIAKEHYTFMSHLRWTPAIALGYAAGVTVHLLSH